jgi:hypothetical protein
MIGDKFEYNGKTYTIKRDITFGEYRKVNRVTNSLGQLAKQYGNPEDLSELPQTELNNIFSEFTEQSESQMELMADFLEKTLGLKQDDLDNMTLNEAAGLFNEAFTKATTVKKNSNKTSSSPYS